MDFHRPPCLSTADVWKRYSVYSMHHVPRKSAKHSVAPNDDGHRVAVITTTSHRDYTDAGRAAKGNWRGRTRPQATRQRFPESAPIQQRRASVWIWGHFSDAWVITISDGGRSNAQRQPTKSTKPQRKRLDQHVRSRVSKPHAFTLSNAIARQISEGTSQGSLLAARQRPTRLESGRRGDGWRADIPMPP